MDTIAAIATGDVVSAVGIVRVSGTEALTVADNFFRAADGVSLTVAVSKQMYYGEFRNNNNKLLDLCLCSVSRAPHSYTGEDTVEFFCHGSPVLLSGVLDALFSVGVRQALPGEFTKRAFLNGRMDLTQAEAVIDLIESETIGAAQNAVGQLHGAITVKMDFVYERLIDITAHFHAVIDYPDEDIDEFKSENYLGILRSVADDLKKLLDSHDRGKVLRTGIPTVIIGRPNTGKSSLLNAMLGYERAIVTDIAGTTRDTIEEKVIIGNVLLRLIDTAGLRKTDDSIEKLGVDRTLSALNGAGLVIIVFDGSEPLKSEDHDVLRSIPPDVPKIAIVNKSDLDVVLDFDELNEFDVKYCTLSALSGEGLNILDDEIQKLFPDHISDSVTNTLPGFNCDLSSDLNSGSSSGKFSQGELITNSRQAEAVSRALINVESAISSLTASVTPDAVLLDIEAAMAAIGEITGKTVRKDIISGIFDRFCVGK